MSGLTIHVGSRRAILHSIHVRSGLTVPYILGNANDVMLSKGNASLPNFKSFNVILVF